MSYRKVLMAFTDRLTASDRGIMRGHVIQLHEQCLGLLGRPEELEDCIYKLKLIIKVDPEFTPVYETLGKAYHKMGEYYGIAGTYEDDWERTQFKISKEIIPTSRLTPKKLAILVGSLIILVIGIYFLLPY